MHRICVLKMSNLFTEAVKRDLTSEIIRFEILQVLALKSEFSDGSVSSLDPSLILLSISVFTILLLYSPGALAKPSLYPFSCLFLNPCFWCHFLIPFLPIESIFLRKQKFLLFTFFNFLRSQITGLDYQTQLTIFSITFR